MSCLHTFLHWLSSKTVATTCHLNSSSLSISSIDHFSLKPPWLYTFQPLLLTLTFYPFADTHSSTQFFCYIWALSLEHLMLWSSQSAHSLSQHTPSQQPPKYWVSISTYKIHPFWGPDSKLQLSTESHEYLTGISSASPKQIASSQILLLTLQLPWQWKALSCTQFPKRSSILYPSPINLRHHTSLGSFKCVSFLPWLLPQVQAINIYYLHYYRSCLNHLFSFFLASL